MTARAVTTRVAFRIVLPVAWAVVVAVVNVVLMDKLLHLGTNAVEPILLAGALAPFPLGLLGSLTTRSSDNLLHVVKLAGLAATVEAVAVFVVEMQADPTGCGVSPGQGDCDTAYGLGVSVLFALAFVEFFLVIAGGWWVLRVLRRFGQRRVMSNGL